MVACHAEHDDRSVVHDRRVRLREGQTRATLEGEIARLRLELQNFSGWSAGPSLEGLRNVYLTWVGSAEEVARRLLRDVPSDQFATARWQSVLAGQVPSDRLWSVIEGDAQAQLDWFGGVLADIPVTVEVSLAGFALGRMHRSSSTCD